MIVMNPDHVPGFYYFSNRVSEDLIHFHILGPVLLAEPGMGRKIMEQRPDRAIAEPMVELVHRVSIDKYGIGLFLGRLLSQFVMRLFVDLDSRPSNPKVINAGRVLSRPVQVRGQAGDETAGARSEDQLPLLTARRKGKPIGDDQQSHINRPCVPLSPISLPHRRVTLP